MALAEALFSIEGRPMTMITFRPDQGIEAQPLGRIETALFVGVRAEPPLESTQLRWQVRVGTGDTVQLQTGGTNLENLGGALFLTSKEPLLETASDDAPAPIGWMKWIAEDGRRSYQIQLAISRAGFDRVCHLAEKGRYPDALLTFKDDGHIEEGMSSGGNEKIWINVGSKIALISEFTLRYDFSQFGSMS
jgi:hypothetical protein